MRSLHDVTNYIDRKRQKSVADSPFVFRDFTKDVRPPAKAVKTVHGSANLPDSAGSANAEQEDALPKLTQEEELSAASEEARRILAEAENKACALFERSSDTAERLMEMTRERAAVIEEEARQEGYRQGYEEGIKKGTEDGMERYYLDMGEKYNNFFAGLDSALFSLDSLRRKRIRDQLEEMKDLVITVARKIIHIGLESSGEVIKQMILIAAENGRDKQWSKVFISASDDAKMKADGIDMARLLTSYSDRIKLVVSEDAQPGSCVVEFPDQIIDAGAETQLENIKGLIDEFEANAGPEVQDAL